MNFKAGFLSNYLCGPLPYNCEIKSVELTAK